MLKKALWIGIPLLFMMAYSTGFVEIHPALLSYELWGGWLIFLYGYLLYKRLRRRYFAIIITIASSLFGWKLFIHTGTEPYKEYLFSKEGYHFYKHHGFPAIGLNKCSWDGDCDVFVYKTIAILPFISYYVKTLEEDAILFRFASPKDVQIAYDSIHYCNKIILIEIATGAKIEYFLD